MLFAYLYSLCFSLLVYGIVFLIYKDLWEMYIGLTSLWTLSDSIRSDFI